jgi:hypothetical protein
MERRLTGPMEVPPSRNPDAHMDCAREHSLSTINLFSFIPVRLSCENLQDDMYRWSIISPHLIAINSNGTMYADLFREASLERRLSIVLLEIGLFFPVKMYGVLKLWNVYTRRWSKSFQLYTRENHQKYLSRDLKGPILHLVHLPSSELFLM